MHVSYFWLYFIVIRHFKVEFGNEKIFLGANAPKVKSSNTPNIRVIIALSVRVHTAIMEENSPSIGLIFLIAARRPIVVRASIFKSYGNSWIYFRPINYAFKLIYIWESPVTISI